MPEPIRIPVVLDTDIGGDIDDTWALAMMLGCPELDVRLVVSDTGDTDYRARIIAKYLHTVGRTDIPVGVGTAYPGRRNRNQLPWVEDYDLAAYPGTVYADGVQAIIDAVMASDRKVTLICIGPVPNIADALVREPRIAERARFVGMHGSVRKGYNGSDAVCAECNVVNHTEACQTVFSAPWEVTITPLDTCGTVVLDGALYRRVYESSEPGCRALMENYRIWLEHASWAKDGDAERRHRTRSSVLFDTVAVYLAYCEELVDMETLPIAVTGDGFTRITPGAKDVRVAARWRDLDAFRAHMVERVLAGGRCS